MSLALRIILLVSAVFVAIFVLRNVKKSVMRIEDTLFWVIVTAVVLIIGIFPQIVGFFSTTFGFASEQNFVFLFFIFVLLVNGYYTSRANSDLETKVKELTQQIALDRLDHYERTRAQDAERRDDTTTSGE